jgi:hypothetical protein
MQRIIMKRIILFFIIFVSSLAGMESESKDIVGSNNAHLVRLASFVKNKIYEIKADLNYSDASGSISIMHLQIFEPGKNQTQNGIFLECIKNIPCAIHLPYGRWQFAKPLEDSGDHVKKLMAQLSLEFDLELETNYTARRTFKKRIGIAGDPICIYAIMRVGQVALEKGAYKDETEYMDAIHAKAAWEAIFTE